MSRTTTMKFAGACALAMTIASGAFAHGGGGGGGMSGGSNIGSHPTMPAPVSRPTEFGTRPSTGTREMPSVAARNPAAATRVAPTTGTRLPVMKTISPTETGRKPTTTQQFRLDPPPGGNN